MNSTPKPRRAPGAPYTVSEAAERLNLSTSTIYELIRDGQIKARKVGVRRTRYRIDETDLMAYWASCVATEPSRGRAVKDHLS